MGELQKRLKQLAFDENYDWESKLEVDKILEEAKKEFALSEKLIKRSGKRGWQSYMKTTLDWFEKWFGGEPQK